MMRKALAILLILIIPSILFGQSNSPLSIYNLTGNYYIFVTHITLNGTSFPANGMYLVTEEGVVVFDSPWDSTQFQPLLDSIKVKHGKNVVMAIATHSHEDRTGGLEFFKKQGIKTFTSFSTDSISKEKNEKRAEYLFQNDTIFNVGSSVFQTYYPGPGHTMDNIVIWFPEDKILYGGCFIKSAEATDLGYVKEGDVEAWPQSINNVKKKFGKPKYIVPGHQDWRDTGSLKHTLQLLKNKNK